MYITKRASTMIERENKNPINNKKEEYIKNPTESEAELSAKAGYIFETLDGIFKSDNSQNWLGDKKQDIELSIELRNGSETLKISHFGPSLVELAKDYPDHDHVLYSVKHSSGKGYDIVSTGKLVVDGEIFPEKLDIYSWDQSNETDDLKNNIGFNKMLGASALGVNMINLPGPHFDNKKEIRHNMALNRLDLRLQAGIEEKANADQLEEFKNTLEQFYTDK